MDPELERTVVLARDTHFHAIHTLCAMLPPPATDDPDALVRRDSAAMAQVCSMIPVNADEIAQAVVIAAATAHAGDVMRVVSQSGADGVKYLEQAARMLRQANAARSLLLRTQAVRLKREGNNAATDAAAWTEHFALRDMLNAKGRKPNGEPEPSATAGETRTDPAVVPGEARSASGGPEQTVSVSDTSSRLSGGETTMRRDHRTPTDSAAADSPPEGDPPLRPPVSRPAIETVAGLPSYLQAGRCNARSSGDVAGGESRLSPVAADRVADLLRRAELLSNTSLFSTGLS